ncbi:uncharacterized protein METZ01_LOCUS215357 [marine metagenome]|uniref:Uncharacterized protein n=1 Tax=marine metagenome TaxID=408172 RepID=A0A382FJW9_9ZZZZ
MSAFCIHNLQTQHPLADGLAPGKQEIAIDHKENGREPQRPFDNNWQFVRKEKNKTRVADVASNGEKNEHPNQHQRIE